MTLLFGATEFKWASQRWSAAREMRLERCHASQVVALGDMCAGGHVMPPHLQHLSLGIQWGEPEECMAWLPMVLAQTPELHSLKLTMPKLLRVPPLLQLRHLVLTFFGCTEGCLADLALLTSLQTLSLEALYPKMQDRFTEIDLRPLVRLQQVRLFDIQCEAVYVGENCQVHVDVTDHISYDSEGFNPACLAEVLPMTSSVSWTESGGVLTNPLPAFLTQAGNLSCVWLEVDTVGALGAPLILEGNLGKLRELRIRAKFAYLHLPATLAVDALMIDLVLELCLTCEDVGAFVEGVRAFKIVYKVDNGSFLNMVGPAMAARGMAMEVTSCRLGRNTQVQHKPDGVQALDVRCSCGCCSVCLVKAGLMPGDAGYA